MTDRAPWATVVDAGRLAPGLDLPTWATTFDPPHGTDVAAFGAAAALAAYRATGLAPCAGRGPTVLLARMTGPARTALVYLLRWDDVPVQGTGGPAGSAADRPGPSPGVQYGIVDARTGEHLGTRQSVRYDRADRAAGERPWRPPSEKA